MPLLPEKIVNYIVKQLGGMIFEKIVERAKDIKGTAWEKELKENEKRENKNMFYGWLDERIKNWDKTENVRKSKM